MRLFAQLMLCSVLDFWYALTSESKPIILLHHGCKINLESKQSDRNFLSILTIVIKIILLAGSEEHGTTVVAIMLHIRYLALVS